MELKNKSYTLYATEYDGIEYDSIEFTQNDTNNSQLDLIMPYEADEVVLTVVKPSSDEVVARFPKVDSNTNFSLELDSDLINESGTYKATVQAYGHDYDRRTVGTFKYKIATEVNSNSIPTDDRVPILTTLISDVNSLYDKVVNIDHGEGGRILAEEQRVANETKRETNETKREANDKVREEKIKEFSTSLETMANNTLNIVNFPKLVGEIDDTGCLKRAITFCSNNKIILELENSNEYIISDYLPVFDNTKIKGNGSTIIANKQMFSIFYTNDGLDWNSSNYKIFENVEIKDLILNTNNLARCGVYCALKNSLINNIKVVELDTLEHSLYGIKLTPQSENVTISDCEAKCKIVQRDESVGEGLAPISVAGATIDSVGGLSVGAEIIDPLCVSSNVTIKNCKTIGGLQGILILAGKNICIKNNTVEYSKARAILLSQNSCDCIVDNNTIRQFGSSAIHIYAGSHNNHISNNIIESDGTYKPYLLTMFDGIGRGGESAIQCYLRCYNNKIKNNIIKSKSTNYGIYSAINCDGIEISNNTIESGFIACIGIESDWLARPLNVKNFFSRPNFEPVTNINNSFNSWSNGKSFSNITIKNNICYITETHTGVKRCGIYLAQIGTAILKNTTIEDNIINWTISNSCDYEVVADDTALFQSIVFKKNSHNPSQDHRLNFNNVKFQKYEHNSWQTTLKGSATIDNNTLDIGKQNYYYIYNVCTINSITGFNIADSEIREIFIRCAINSKIQNSSTIKLKTTSDYTFTTGYEILHFVTINGVLFQI